MDMNVNQGSEEAIGEKETNALLSASRKIILAGIGAIALAQDEIEDFVNKLVERGEIAENDGRKLIREVREKRRMTTRQVDVRMENMVMDILTRMNVPTKTDIELLGDKIAALSKKIDNLKKNP
ncbi:MAG: poly(hydroxyalkanoate) granule-associated protein [Chloroflexi bacterium]|nr:MAG: poly(hydroxyalkanoate) granule-associated protein [Chloroflexota bacterium]